MNNQIMEYAREARLYAQGIYPEVNDIKEWGQVYHEKFAELIVKECLAQVDKVDAMIDDDKEKTGVAWVGLAIAKHFGVE